MTLAAGLDRPRATRCLSDGLTIPHAASVPFEIFAVGGRSISAILGVLLSPWLYDAAARHRRLAFPNHLGLMLWLYVVWAVATVFPSEAPSSASSVVGSLLLQAALVPVLAARSGEPRGQRSSTEDRFRRSAAPGGALLRLAWVSERIDRRRPMDAVRVVAALRAQGM